MMKVQLVRIADRGVPNRERVHLSVLAEVDLSFFVLLKSFLVAPAYDKVANGVTPAFWFPTIHAKAGDQLVLYSGKGTPTSRKEPSGMTTYFFYWNMDHTVWNMPVECAVLFEAAEWATSSFGS